MNLPTPETICFDALPSLPLAEYKALPRISALYFVLNTAQECVYIGRTQSLGLRWRAHHRYAILATRQYALIAWLPVEDAAMLPWVEKLFIEYFSPKYNGPVVITKRKPKRFKHTTSFRLTIDAQIMLKALSNHCGISQASVIETLIREKAKREKVSVPVSHTSELAFTFA